MELKYIVTDKNDFAIFTKLTQHSDIGHKLHGKPVGAGFCHLVREEEDVEAHFKCYGRSVSLNLHSRPEDTDIINKVI